MNSTRNQYVPDYISPPGETLEEALEERGMTQVDLAQRIGMSRKHVKQILDGAAPITPETALKLERALGIPARFWNNREQQYRDFLARKAEEEELDKCKAWLKNFKHVRKMRELRWFRETQDPIAQLRAVLDFFGMASPKAWQAHWEAVEVRYRRSHAYKPDPYALAAWLRRGEVEAQGIDCAPYDEARFRTALEKVRKLTLEPPRVFQPRLVELCAGCGVAVVFVPELPKTASGATRWLTASKALIQLSLKYKTDDHLWFTFFHEAGHILLHPKKDIFLDEKNEEDLFIEAGSGAFEEEEANRFAARTLIPQADFRAFVTARSRFSKASIRQFAQEQGIAPGIVVGQLQHAKKLPFSHCNDLKQRFTWRLRMRKKPTQN